MPRIPSALAALLVAALLVAALLVATGTAFAQDGRPTPAPTPPPAFNDPAALVTWLVRHGETLGFDDDKANATVFSPGLRAALRTATERSRRAREVPCGMDANIVLECQDCSPPQHLRVTSQPTAPGRAAVTTSFDLMGEHRAPRFMTVLLDGSWKVEDIVSPLGGSLRRRLRCLS